MVEKGNVQVFPKQFILECKEFKVISDGLPQHTEIFIDGQRAYGIYDLKIAVNTKRPLRVELGVFLRNFKFSVVSKDQKDTQEVPHGKDRRFDGEGSENCSGKVY